MSVNTYSYEGYQPGIPQGLPGHVPAVVHKQYNSPLPLYSAENVAEALATQTEALTNGAVGVNFHAIGTPVLKRSEVYRMVQEEQRQTTTTTTTGGRPGPGQQNTSSPEPTFQSQSFIRIQRTLDESGRPISPTSPTPGSDARRGAPAVPLSGTGPQAQSVPKHVAEQQRYSAAPNQPQPYYQNQYQPPQQQQYYQQRTPDYYNQQQQQQPQRREPIRQQQYPQQQATPPSRARPQSPPHQYQPASQQQPEYRPPPQQQQPSEYRPPPQQQQQQQQQPEYRPQPSEYRPPPQQQQPSEYRPPPQAQQPQPNDYRPQQQPQQRQQQAPTSPSTHKRRVAPKQDPYRYTATGTGYQAPPMNSVSPSGRRRPVWPPPSSVPALQTSTQSIHWIGSKGQKKFVWPPPKAYTSYDYDEAQKYREEPLSRSEAQERADSFITPGSRTVIRSHPRAPARLAAQAWEPYMGAKEEGRHPLHRRNPRKTRRFEEVITMSNSTRLPPTYRPPPGTQHITLDYEFESEEEEEEEEEED